MIKFLTCISVIAAALLIMLSAAVTNAQRRDCFTEAELDLVRDAQDIDLRMKVLTRAIDRRLAVLNIDSNPSEKPPKDADKWGDPPTGSRGELLTDIKRIIQKAVDDIDDAAANAGTVRARTPENTSKKDKTDPPFARATHILLAAAQRYKPLLSAESDKTTVMAEKNPIAGAVELCDQIIEALSKLPAAPPTVK